MQDPFRPNSNAQLMREAQIGFIVIGLLLCVLLYVAFFRLTNRSSRFDEIARNVAVAEPVDSDPYQAHAVVQMEKKREQRLGRDNKKAFAAIEEFSSTVEAARLQQTPPDQKVAQATHVSTHFSPLGGSKKPAPTTLPSPKVATSFTPVKKHIAKVPRSFEPRLGRSDTSGRSNRELGTDKGENPRKHPRVVPPVLTSKFGSMPSQDFLPAPVLKKAETKADPIGFEASPPLPSRLDANSASHIPSKPPVTDSSENALARPLPVPARKDQATDLLGKRSTPLKQRGSRKIEFEQSDESSLIAQTSAFEPVKVAVNPLSKPIEKRAKTFAKAGKTYSTKKGDSLWAIAQGVYGDGRYFLALHQVNHETLSASESIPVGTLLKVPSIEELQKDFAELCPQQEQVRHAQDEMATEDTNQRLDDELDQRFYRTEDGDTLFEIARQRLGQASRYLEIYELNRFRIPETANHLTPLGGGIQLLLPQ